MGNTDERSKQMVITQVAQGTWFFDMPNSFTHNVLWTHYVGLETLNKSR
jgi:hypothetical protein